MEGLRYKQGRENGAFRSPAWRPQKPPSRFVAAQMVSGLKSFLQRLSKETNTDQSKTHSFGSQTGDNGHFRPCYPVPILAGRYKLLQTIGEGQSSVLIAAEDLFHPDKNAVAIKIMHLSFTTLGAQEADCIRELNTADPLGISKTVRLLNKFMFDGHYCMVFELLRPRPLHRYFQNAQFDNEDKKMVLIKDIAVQLLGVLGFLKRENVIHADLKPENILLQEGDKIKVKVVDFGNAIRWIHREVSLYYDEFELQTLLYRAPEVVFGLPFGQEIDMWSLGCILAELFLGQPLFFGTSKAAVLQEMVKILGPLPRSPFKSGKFYSTFSSFTSQMSIQIGAGASSLETRLMKKLKNTRNFTFANFLAGLLRYNPSQRLTPSQAATHPFLASESPMSYFFNPSSGIEISQAPSPAYSGILLTPETYPFRPHIDEDITRRRFSGLELLRVGTKSKETEDEKLLAPPPVGRVAPLIHTIKDDKSAVTSESSRDPSSLSRDQASISRDRNSLSRDSNSTARDQKSLSRGSSSSARDPESLSRDPSFSTRDRNALLRDSTSSSGKSDKYVRLRSARPSCSNESPSLYPSAPDERQSLEKPSKQFSPPSTKALGFTPPVKKFESLERDIMSKLGALENVSGKLPSPEMKFDKGNKEEKTLKFYHCTTGESTTAVRSTRRASDHLRAAIDVSATSDKNSTRRMLTSMDTNKSSSDSKTAHANLGSISRSMAKKEESACSWAGEKPLVGSVETGMASGKNRHTEKKSGGLTKIASVTSEGPTKRNSATPDRPTKSISVTPDRRTKNVYITSEGPTKKNSATPNRSTKSISLTPDRSAKTTLITLDKPMNRNSLTSEKPKRSDLGTPDRPTKTLISPKRTTKRSPIAGDRDSATLDRRTRRETKEINPYGPTKMNPDGPKRDSDQISIAPRSGNKSDVPKSERQKIKSPVDQISIAPRSGNKSDVPKSERQKIKSPVDQISIAPWSGKKSDVPSSERQRIQSPDDQISIAPRSGKKSDVPKSERQRIKLPVDQISIAPRSGKKSDVPSSERQRIKSPDDQISIAPRSDKKCDVSSFERRKIKSPDYKNKLVPPSRGASRRMNTASHTANPTPCSDIPVTRTCNVYTKSSTEPETMFVNLVDEDVSSSGRFELVDVPDDTDKSDLYSDHNTESTHYTHNTNYTYSTHYTHSSGMESSDSDGDYTPKKCDVPSFERRKIKSPDYKNKLVPPSRGASRRMNTASHTANPTPCSDIPVTRTCTVYATSSAEPEVVFVDLVDEDVSSSGRFELVDVPDDTDKSDLYSDHNTESTHYTHNTNYTYSTHYTHSSGMESSDSDGDYTPKKSKKARRSIEDQTKESARTRVYYRERKRRSADPSSDTVTGTYSNKGQQHKRRARPVLENDPHSDDDVLLL